MPVDKSHLKIVKPQSEAERERRTTLDTIFVTPESARQWRVPTFQRELKVNEKVMQISREIAQSGLIPGTITLGVLDNHLYIIDGQHRREAFLLADITEGIADVRYCHFKTEAEMGDEFVKLNSHIVTMRPDDILRGLEKSNPALAKLRRACPFVGYGQIRRGEKSPVVSMSALLRCWFGSAPEVPAAGGLTATKVVQNLSDEEVETLTSFLNIAFAAWGRNLEHARLWGNLNLTVCMWMFRRLVITPYSTSTKKLGKELFQKCLMSVAADAHYNDYLVGRALRERDRSPTYSKLKGIFARRIEAETGDKPRLPSPDWGGR